MSLPVADAACVGTDPGSVGHGGCIRSLVVECSGTRVEFLFVSSRRAIGSLRDFRYGQTTTI